MAADATLASSQAQLLPSINLTATGSLQDRTLPDLLDNPLRLWSLGGSILAPLLNRQALNAQVDVSMAQRNQALYSYEKTVRSAFKEVNDSPTPSVAMANSYPSFRNKRPLPRNLTYCTKPLP